MNLSRSRPVGSDPSVSATTKVKKTSKEYTLDHFLTRLDYVGAITYLEFQRQNALNPQKKDEFTKWIAYCHFHLGDYVQARKLYDELLVSAKQRGEQTGIEDVRLHREICSFYLGFVKEARDGALPLPPSALRNRLLLHASHRLGDHEALLKYHSDLKPRLEDQLCLASIHYLRSHFQEATQIYRALLMENREFVALNTYIAMCYYKLDYYDVSLEILDGYLQKHPTSSVSLNLRACNQFRLTNGFQAEKELKPILERESISSGQQDFLSDIIKHNLVVFRDGENAAQVFAPLVDVVPEARLNYAVCKLREGEYKEAKELLDPVTPVLPQEYILKAVVLAAIGQQTRNEDDVVLAQQYFQLVGTSETERDTIPGRQCMASFHYLSENWDDVLLYLRSIEDFFPSEDDFFWNFGIALASKGHYDEAETALLNVKSEKLRNSFIYLCWLARVYIMIGKPELAWEIYLRSDASQESLDLLKAIANDCYKTRAYFFAAKAFDVLERLDPDPTYWAGKRGACLGVIQQVVQGKETAITGEERLREVMSLLLQSSNHEAREILKTIQEWAQQCSPDSPASRMG